MMKIDPSANKELFIGIDGGGTKCKARLEDQYGQFLAEAITGPANASRDLHGAKNSVIEACKECLAKANLAPERLHDLHVGIGLAGINLPNVKEAFVQQKLPFKQYAVTTDLHIACLGAHGGQNGAIVIIGTGSSGIAIHDNEQIMLGGHGFQVGDKGSGAWIGKMAVAHCLETLDGIHKPNELADAVMQHLNNNRALDIALLAVSAAPAFFATLAPMVFMLAAKKQVTALDIVEQAALYISKLSCNLLAHSQSRLSYIGGVSESLLAYIDHDLRQQISPALSPPEVGAIHFIHSSLLTETL